MAEPGGQEEKRGLFGFLKKREQPTAAPVEPENTPIIEEGSSIDETPPPDLTSKVERKFKQVIDIPTDKVESLIETKTKMDPAKRAELLTRARILRPLLEDSSRLGLDEAEQQAVRKYARAAGDRAKQETQELIGQSPLERLDQILYAVGGKLPDYDQQRVMFSLGSQGIRIKFQEIADAVAAEQQQRDFDGKPAGFDKVLEDYLEEIRMSKHYGDPRSADAANLLVAQIDSQNTELVLKGLGVLNEKHTLKNLQNSQHWLEIDPGKRYGDAVAGSVINIADSQGVFFSAIDTQIPGVKAIIVEYDRHHSGSELNHTFNISLVFTPEVVAEIVKIPIAPSIFRRE